MTPKTPISITTGCLAAMLVVAASRTCATSVDTKYLEYADITALQELKPEDELVGLEKNFDLLLSLKEILAAKTPPPKPYVQKIEKTFGEYTVSISTRLSKHLGDKAELYISKDGENVFSLLRDKGAFKVLETGYDIDVSMGNDITGDGMPNLVIQEWTGGASCCTLFHIFQIGESFRHIQTIDNWRGDRFPFINDEPGTGLEFTLFDWAPYSGSGPRSDSIGAEIFLKYNGESYEVAYDLMRYSPPIDPDVERWASTMHKAYSMGDSRAKAFVEVEICKRLTNLIYSGNIHATVDVIDLAWPDEMTGKEEFRKKYRSSIEGSAHWEDLKIINGINEWPSGTANREGLSFEFSRENLKAIRQQMAVNHDSRKTVPAIPTQASHKKEVVEYSLEQLQSFIGDPNYPQEAVSPDGTTVLLIDEDCNVVTKDLQSKTMRVIQPLEDGSWGTMGARWVTRDRGVVYVNNGEFVISVTTELPGGQTTVWDAQTWQNITPYLWPRDFCDDGYIKVSPDGRYAAIAGDGPKFGRCFSLIDFEKREYRLLSGMKWLEATGSIIPIDGMGTKGHVGGEFQFGFTPDSQQLVLEYSSTQFGLYDLKTETISALQFTPKAITDIRYLDGNPNDPNYDINNPEFGEDRDIARIKIFQKAMKEERLDIIVRYFDFPITRGEYRIYSIGEFIDHFDEIFPEDYRKLIAEEKEISKMGSHGYMLGYGYEWFDLSGFTIISNH